MLYGSAVLHVPMQRLLDPGPGCDTFVSWACSFKL
eukprot:gene5815-5279_t